MIEREPGVHTPYASPPTGRLSSASVNVAWARSLMLASGGQRSGLSIRCGLLIQRPPLSIRVSPIRVRQGSLEKPRAALAKQVARQAFRQRNDGEDGRQTERTGKGTCVGNVQARYLLLLVLVNYSTDTGCATRVSRFDGPVEDRLRPYPGSYQQGAMQLLGLL